MITLESTTPEEVRQMPADSVDLRVLCALAVGYSFRAEFVKDVPNRRMEGDFFFVRIYGKDGKILCDGGGYDDHWKELAKMFLPDFANDPAAANLVLEHIESHHKCAWQTGKTGMVGNSYDCVAAPVIDDDCDDCTRSTGESWMHAAAKVGVLLALERGK